MSEQQELQEFIRTNTMLLDTMLGDIEFGCFRMEKSISHLDYCLKNRCSSNETWYYLINILDIASALSRILKPAPYHRRKEAAQKLSVNRGESLRFLFGINDDNVILERKLRNRFIHTDEYLDDWWLENTRKWIARRNIADSDSIMKGFEESENFEHFNSKALTINYHGEKYHLQEMWNAIEKIKKQLPSVRKKLNDRSYQ